MKKIVFIVCLALLSMWVNAHTRLTPETYHFVSLHADAGYSALLHNIQGHAPSAGMNTNLGIDYRLYHNVFLFSVGVEGMYELNANRMEDHDEAIPMMDTEGDIFQMHLHVDKARDLSHMVNLNIPLLMGGEWGRFYFMIGPKFSINMYGATTSSAKVTTYGEYERYYDDFYDMPNHQFITGMPVKSDMLKMKWNFNILAHIEIGGRIGHMFKHKQFRLNPDKVRMYLAGYVDFGVLNLITGKGGAPVFGYEETDHGVQFYSQPLLLSNLTDGATFRNLNIGIKYTIAFEGKKRQKSYIYDYNRVERNYRKRGGNQNIH